MPLAPIIVFAYNRPEHLRQTLEALEKNIFASDSTLYIYCDGAKDKISAEHQQKVSDTQTYAVNYASFAKQRKLYREVHVVCSQKNKGLANSIIGGVSEVMLQHKHDRIIVLEDDLITSPYFLKYMNEALDKYSNYPAVFSVSANRPPMEKMHIPEDYPYDVFASLRSYSTGWGTWLSRWEQIDWSLDYLNEFLLHPEQIEAFNRGGDDLTEMLIMQREEKIDSWAIRFSFQHFKHHAVAILPCIPYVDNIGFDGSGVHSGIDAAGVFRNDLSKSVKDPRLMDIIYEDSRIVNAFYNVFCRKKKSIGRKAIDYVYRKINKENNIVKKKIYV